MVEGPVGRLGRVARLPRSRADAARVVLVLILLEAALGAFLFGSARWIVGLAEPARTIVLVFTIATALTFVLFAVSLLVDALPVLMGRRRRDEPGQEGR